MAEIQCLIPLGSGRCSRVRSSRSNIQAGAAASYGLPWPFFRPRDTPTRVCGPAWQHASPPRGYPQIPPRARIFVARVYRGPGGGGGVGTGPGPDGLGVGCGPPGFGPGVGFLCPWPSPPSAHRALVSTAQSLSHDGTATPVPCRRTSNLRGVDGGEPCLSRGQKRNFCRSEPRPSRRNHATARFASRSIPSSGSSSESRG